MSGAALDCHCVWLVVYCVCVLALVAVGVCGCALCLHMGVVQYYGSQKLFFRRAFADLSHPFAPNVKCIRIYDIIFVILFSVEDLSRATKVHPSYMQQ